VNEFQHRIAEQERALTIVEAPHHFVEVGREMLRTDFMPPAHDAALEQGECGLHAVCGSLPGRTPLRSGGPFRVSLLASQLSS
jgi:hypothetical protein